MREAKLFNDNFQNFKRYGIPKAQQFRNGGVVAENGKIEAGTGHMIFNWFEWKRDNKNIYPKIHPTQKPVGLLKELIEIFTDEGDVVIDPVAGSGTTLRASMELKRHSYGFEIGKEFCKRAKKEMLVLPEDNQINLMDLTS